MNSNVLRAITELTFDLTLWIRSKGVGPCGGVYIRPPVHHLEAQRIHSVPLGLVSFTDDAHED